MIDADAFGLINEECHCPEPAGRYSNEKAAAYLRMQSTRCVSDVNLLILVLDFPGGDMGFPDNIGKGTMAIHPNASPRDEIMSLLSQLPPATMVYDNTDEKGRFDRIFVENGTSLMYVHVGSSTGDTVVILFKDGDKDNINDFVNKINQELKEHND